MESSTIRYRQGTSNKVMNVANNTPHASEIAYVFGHAATLTPGPEADLAKPVSTYWSK